MSDDQSNEKHTPETIMKKLQACESELGKQMEAMREEFHDNQNLLREELTDHQDIVSSMKSDWDQFLLDFTEMLSIFRTAKGFFRFLGWIGVLAKWTIAIGLVGGAIWTLVTTGHWPGAGK